MEDQELVFNNDGKIETNSLLVAERFGKQHKDVLDAIREILTAENPAVRIMFSESTYYNSRNKIQPMFLMNRDGWSVLAMGFTGKEALKFKLQFISAFNVMEQIIVKSSFTLPDFSNAGEAARAWADQFDQTEKAKAIVEEQSKKLDHFNGANGIYNATQVAKEHNMTAEVFNELLFKKRIQFKTGKTWVLYASYENMGLTDVRTIVFNTSKGKGSAMQMVWTEKGRSFIYDLFNPPTQLRLAA